jgi:hypothetical protein
MECNLRSSRYHRVLGLFLHILSKIYLFYGIRVEKKTHFQSKLGSFDGSDVASRTGSDHNQIGVVCCRISTMMENSQDSLVTSYQI